MSQKWEKINKKFDWLKVALVNISRNTVPDWVTFPIDEAIFIFGTIYCLGQGISVLINCSIPSLVSDNLISYSPSAHVWGRFCWRSRLVKFDFAFSLVKNKIQVDLCRQRIFTTCHLWKCWYRVYWYLQ